jgi:hypothetical protein
MLILNMAENFKFSNITLLNIIVIAVLVFQIVHPVGVMAVETGAEPIRITVMPFGEYGSSKIYPGIAAEAGRALENEGFIEYIPPETDYEDAYSITPLYLWGGINAGGKEGGMIWRINKERFSEFESATSAEYIVYGVLNKSESGWVIEASVVSAEGGKAGEDIRANGTDEDVSAGITAIAAGVTERLRPVYLVRASESDLRRYLAGMESLSVVVKRLKKRVGKYPDALSHRVLLLRMYQEDRKKYWDDILPESMKVIDLYKKATDEQRRYLLYQDIDPFDIAASVHEKSGDWTNAIYIRKEAVSVFPSDSERHRSMLVRDYMALAGLYEKKGSRQEARKVLNEALQYVRPESKAAWRIGQFLGRLAE